ncbi:peptidase associated/transthyretin-like domain-containing protein [Hymenobacter daeguensis]
MKSENLPKIEAEQYDPNLDAQDEDVLSGGNNRLTYILVGLIVALVIGYVALPKGNGSGLASVTPTFMLDDAAVVASVPAASPSDEAKETDAQSTDEQRSPKTPKKTVPTAGASQAVAGIAATTPEVAAAPAPAAAPEAAPAAAPAAEAAPANVTMTGKIEDENGRPLVGATVLLKGSSKGTSTDANGNYSLEVPAGTDNTLIYGYGGYDDEVMRTRGNQPVNVTLTPRAKTGKRRR